MIIRRSIWVLLPLLFLGCEDDTTTVIPPPPLTAEDAQVVANCRALQDALEEYAAAHNGSYGPGWLPGLGSFVNPYTGESEPSGPFPATPGRIGLEAYHACDADVLGYRITGHGKDGVLITLENLSRVPEDIRYKHDVTMANALLVFDAAKRYAAVNGQFPGDVDGTPGVDGKTLLDWLPNGELLINPVTSMQDNPVDGAPAEGGSIGYTPFDMAGDGTYSGCDVSATACNGSYLLTLVPFSQKEESVFQDALYLRLAVHNFKQASGHYPHNLDSETTPGGKTALELLFESGHNLENPYTNQEYVPAIGIATGKGEVAYQPIETDGVVTDFLITGRGVFEEILRIGPIE